MTANEHRPASRSTVSSCVGSGPSSLAPAARVAHCDGDEDLGCRPCVRTTSASPPTSAPLFDAIERALLADGPTALRGHRRRMLQSVSAWLALCIGFALLSAGLLRADLLVALGGFVVVLRAVDRLLRRRTWAWVVLRWRRWIAPPPPGENMWEP